MEGKIFINQKTRNRVGVIGAGAGGVSTAIAMSLSGYDVRLFEQNPEPKPLGGGVLLSVPVLAILRHYGIDIENTFGQKTWVQFKNSQGKVRVNLPFNTDVEKAMGIDGWHYGVLRSSAFGKMMEKLRDFDPNLLVPAQRFTAYEDRGDGVVAKFETGKEEEFDLLVGADGINSAVSQQTFGDPKLFHIGLRVWLAWCEDIPEIQKDIGVLHHGRNVQASYFPMKHDGKPGFEWWIVERSSANMEPPSDIEAHVRKLLQPFAYPMTLFPDKTDFQKQIFRWEIYNRPSLNKWSSGRVVCVGDAVHPVSPYAAYGMGMAIEDGYFLTRAIGNGDLSEISVVERATQRYESERVAYCNHQVEFARKLGNIFHHAPGPLAWIRDQIFDHTGLLQKMVQRDSLADSEKMSLSLSELHVS